MDNEFEQQIAATKKALDMAFKKKKRCDSKVRHQAHVLAALEAELAQTLKDIRITKRHLSTVQATTKDAEAQLTTLLQHEVAKLEGEACLADPESFKRYTALQSTTDTRDFLRDLGRRITGLERMRDLTRRKYLLQRREEEEERAQAKRLIEQIQQAAKEMAKKNRESRGAEEQGQGAEGSQVNPSVPSTQSPRSAGRGRGVPLRRGLLEKLMRLSAARRHSEVKQALETEL